MRTLCGPYADPMRALCIDPLLAQADTMLALSVHRLCRPPLCCARSAAVCKGGLGSASRWLNVCSGGGCLLPYLSPHLLPCHGCAWNKKEFLLYFSIIRPLPYHSILCTIPWFVLPSTQPYNGMRRPGLPDTNVLLKPRTVLGTQGRERGSDLRRPTGLCVGMTSLLQTTQHAQQLQTCPTPCNARNPKRGRAMCVPVLRGRAVPFRGAPRRPRRRRGPRPRSGSTALGS